MTIDVGESLPDVKLKLVTADGPKDISSSEYFAGKKVVLFGVPGAFTPTCSNSHLPGFIDNRDAIREKGVDAIAVISVNDHHVMTAWSKFSGGEDKIDFFADGNAAFISALGLDMDMAVAGMGTRAKRFSTIAEDGVVKTLNVEDNPGKAVESGAARILEQL